MFITEDEREQIARDLETMNRGHWLQLESQVHCHGGEANFWFLVAGPERVPELVGLILGPLQAAAARFDQTAFFASIGQKTATEMLTWATISDSEIRDGALVVPLHLQTGSRKLRAYDVFGPNKVPG